MEIWQGYNDYNGDILKCTQKGWFYRFYSEQFYSNDFKWMMIGGYWGYPYDFGSRSICRWVFPTGPASDVFDIKRLFHHLQEFKSIAILTVHTWIFGAEAALVPQAETCRDMEMKNHQQGWKMDLKTLMDMGIR